MEQKLFTGIDIGGLALRNRLLRSATYEGGADEAGVPGPAYRQMYEELAAGGIGMVISGFLYVSRAGHAMHDAQAGFSSPNAIPAFRRVTDVMREAGTPFIAQLAHAGRQTRARVPGGRPASTTRRRSLYFRTRPRKLRSAEIPGIADQFAIAAAHAREAGFDGVQLHAAHGYLLHQFILPEVNRLRGRYGIDSATGIGSLLLEQVIDRVRQTCGKDFPVLVKVSAETDAQPPFFPERFSTLIRILDRKRVAAIEVSYGSMDYALNIFRGGAPFSLALRHNPLFQTRSTLKRTLLTTFFNNRMLPVFRPFEPMYNLDYAAHAKTLTDIPVITVGGVRARNDMEDAIARGAADCVAMSRPFLREPDFAMRLRGGAASSSCSNCNHCVLMVDAGQPTRCYKRTFHSPEGHVS
jgi:2,4-dienoyl-CoA reductase-like NADH-dependent reductase (Old Yellow Enzyme family)